MTEVKLVGRRRMKRIRIRRRTQLFDYLKRKKKKMRVEGGCLILKKMKTTVII